MLSSCAKISFFILCFLAPALFAELSHEEIESGLDDVSNAVDGDWTVGLSGSSTVTVVEKEGAVGGRALKVVVRANEEVDIRRTQLEDPSQVTFRYLLETESGAGMTAGSFGYYDSRVEMVGGAGEIGEWQEVTTSNSSTANWGWTLSAGDSERILFLDAVEVTPGFVLKRKGWGAEVSVYPQKPLYQKGEWVSVEAVPLEEGDEFLFWDGWFQDEGRSWDGILYEDGPVPFLEAVAGRRYAFAGLEALVPLKELDATLIEGDDVATGLILEKTGTSTGSSLQLAIQGPGQLRYSVQRMSGSDSGNWRIGGVAVGVESEERILFFGAGSYDYELGFVGDLELRDIRFVKGYPVRATDQGSGTVEGVPSDGFSELNGELVLEAVAAEGWVFHRWTGSIDSGDARLELRVNREIDVVAEFVRLLEHESLDTIVHDSEVWTASETESGMRFEAPSVTRKASRSSIEWELNGPGLLRFSTQSLDGGATVVVDGVRTIGISDGSQGLEPTARRVELGFGMHKVEVLLDTSDYGDELFDLSISDVVWEPGVKVRIVSTDGGGIDGVDEGESRVAVGTEFNLVAIPDDGFVFVGWIGSKDSMDTTISVTAKRALDLVAVFAKSIEAADWVRGQGGWGDWTSSEGGWVSPETLPQGGFSFLSGELEGPARLKIQLERVGEGSAGVARFSIDSAETDYSSTLNIGSVSTVYLPEGVNTFMIKVEAAENGNYAQLSIADFGIEYEVELSVEGGALAVTPYMSQPDFNDTKRRDYLDKGEVVSFSASTTGPGDFAGWTGPLVDSEESDTFVVDGPIKSVGKYVISEIPRDGSVWELESGSGIYIPLYAPDSIGFDGSSDTFVLKATLEGPGVLSGAALSLANLEVKIGEEGEYRGWYSEGTQPFVPEGTHVVRIRGTLPDYIGTSSPWHAASGIHNLGYYSGYPVFGSAWLGGGGSVTVEPGGSVLAAGESVVVRAVPRERNEFVSWLSPDGESEETFTDTVDGPKNYIAVFQAQAEQNELLWEFEGTAPQVGPYFDGPYDGVFWWTFERGDEDRFAVASTTVSGPGTLWVDVGNPDSAQVNFETAYVDGILVDVSAAQRIDYGVFGVKFDLDEGDHSVEIRGRYEAGTNLNGLSIWIPVLQTEFQITAEGEAGKLVEISGGKESGLYAYGESVEFVAPEETASGESFLGWWRSGVAETLVGSDVALTISASEDARYEARYGNVIRFGDGQYVRRLQGDWGLVDGELGPDGGDLYEASSGFLTFDVLEAGVFRFSALVKSRGLRVIRNNQFYYEDLLGDEKDWVRGSLYLNAGDRLTIESLVIGGFGGDSGARIGDFSFEEVWAPSMVVPLGRDVEVSYGDSGNGILTVAESNADLFESWMIDFELDSSALSVEVEFGDNRVYRPLFSETFESSIGTIRLSNERAWASGSDLGFGFDDEFLGHVVTFFEWRSELDGFDPREERLDLEVEGPVVISFEILFGQQDFEFRVDGASVDTKPDVFERNQLSAQVPAGLHTVSFVHFSEDGDSDMSLKNVSKRSGYLVIKEVFDGGEVFPQSLRNVYSYGESVEYVANPAAGYLFSHWESPYSGSGKYASVRVGIDPVPTPVFVREADQSFSLSGLHWTGRGFSVKEEYSESDGRVVQRVELTGGRGEPLWMTSEIEGPSVLWVLENSDLSAFTLDGMGLNDPSRVNLFFDESGLSVGVPAGRHVLRRDFRDGFSQGTYSDIHSLEPGCLVRVEGIGGSVSVSPELPVYPVGTRVQLVSSLGAQTIWKGLPPGASVEGGVVEFEVAASVSVVALKWSNEELFGEPVQLATHSDFDYVSGGYVLEEWLRNRQSSFIRVTGRESGVFSFSFVVSGSGIPFEKGLHASLNGKEVFFSSEVRQGASGRFLVGEVYLSGPEDVLEFWFRETSEYWNGGYQVRVDELSFVNREFSDYVAWWINALGYLPDEYGIIDPMADFDGDGWPNWVEFDLGMDARARGLGLAIVEESKGSLVLLEPVLTVEQAAKLELKAMWNGEPVEVDLVLEEAALDTLLDGRRARRLAIEASEGDSWLFFYDYLGDVPTMESLLAE